MCQSGNGYKNTSQRDCQPREKRCMCMLLMKPRLRLAPNTCGFGLQSSQNTGKSFGLMCVSWMSNACGRAVYCVFDKQAWKASGFHRWGTWYPQACRFLKLKHHLHSPFEKSLMERTMQHIKDRTKGFDDCFPCRRKKCKLKQVKRWLNLFAYYRNSVIIS